ncbi:hypothetical protein Cgig2_027387 [Carnegiea gigantea]|uniref:Uncharacterized protein n=1 Tax=Carnegiea gigantea TaxID=171969 RepID=A0A9Q1K5D4_9CARY|nr:hypothetical protein Cgig2_027387 [Carnegiea gigantea]
MDEMALYALENFEQYRREVTFPSLPHPFDYEDLCLNFDLIEDEEAARDFGRPSEILCIATGNGGHDFGGALFFSSRSAPYRATHEGLPQLPTLCSRVPNLLVKLTILSNIVWFQCRVHRECIAYGVEVVANFAGHPWLGRRLCRAPQRIGRGFLPMIGRFNLSEQPLPLHHCGDATPQGRTYGRARIPWQARNRSEEEASQNSRLPLPFSLIPSPAA